jgi:aryl-alcohol dehydrogenase-like predicted oxidoreductase
LALVSNHLSLARPAEAFYPGVVSADADGLAWHRRTGIGLLAWSPGARGFFTDRLDPDTPDGRRADLNAYDKKVLAVYGTEQNVERRRRARELGRSKGDFSPVQIALAWVLHQP